MRRKAHAHRPRYPLLDALGAPDDVKDMDNDGLRALAAEIRAFIIDSVTRTGGHLGAGLGVVELTLALFAEYEFNQHDKLVWDVGHQCYPHKILTGRRDALRHAAPVAGAVRLSRPAGVALRHREDRPRRHQHLDRHGLRARLARPAGRMPAARPWR